MVLWLAGLVILIHPMILLAQNSQALADHYALEQQTWLEHITAARILGTQSNFDVKFYHLKLDLDLGFPYVVANVLCRFVAAENNTSSIKLNLRREYAIDSVCGTLNGVLFLSDTITVFLNRSFSVGDSGWVQVYYHGVAPVANGIKGLRYVPHAVNQPLIATLSTPFLSYYWWPCKDGPGDKPDSVYVDITIPDTSIAGIPVAAVSNGILANTMTIGRKKTFQWRERYPIVPYYVMVAVSNYRDFHQTFVGKQGERFPLDYYVFDEHLSAAQEGVADLPQAMAPFSDLFGRYPFQTEKYGMTQIGFYGSIENQTNTVMSQMPLSSLSTSVHELSHMWFGDMITCKDWHHAWLNEGFASYSVALWAEHNAGVQGYTTVMNGCRWFTGGTVYLNDITNPFAIFIGVIYSKGAYVLHMLRGILGDSVFFACLKSYAADKRYRYGNATTEDFQGVCQAVSGRDLAYFFDEWVYDQYYPAYRCSFTQDHATGEARVQIQQTQADSGRRAVFQMPVQLKFLFDGGKDTLVTVWNDQKSQTFLFNISHSISTIVFDPDRWILRADSVQVDKIIDLVDKTADIPLRFDLEQNYPNPFNPSTTINYSLPKTANVSLRIFNTLGQEIAVLVNERKDAGSYQAIWNANVPSGVYFYRLRVGEYVETKKMVLLR